MFKHSALGKKDLKIAAKMAGGRCKSFSLPSSSSPSSPVIIPSVGLGCWQMADDEAGPALGWAVEAGARLVDSAFMYGNEEGVGRAINRCIESG